MVNRLYQTFWSERFLNTFCLAIVFSLFTWISISLLSADPNPVRSGDFPSFYVAGKLFFLNHHALYDLSAQSLTQQMLFNEDGYHVFAYPPFVAPFYTLFSFLSPTVAKVLYLICLVVFLVLTAKLLTYNNSLPLSTFQAISMLLLFAPLTIGFISGQNTPISLLILSVALLFFKRGKWLLSGIAVGFLNFKPQYSIIAAIVFFFLTNSKIHYLIGYLMVTVGQVLLSLFLVGREGIISWLLLLKTLGEMNNNSSENIVKMTSIFSVYRSLSSYHEALALLFVTLCLLILVIVLLRSLKCPEIVCPLIVFLSPQTGFYDLALILPFLLCLIETRNRSNFIWNYLGVCFLIYISLMCQLDLKIQILPIVTLLILWKMARRSTMSTVQV